MGDTVLKTLTTPDEDPKREASSATKIECQPFVRQFTSSTRKAQLARRLAVQHLGEWGYPPASDMSCTVALLVAELAANAVRHDRVPGRDFHLRLAFEAGTRTIRIEVSDACSDQPPTSSPIPSPDDESGRGLLLVDMLATRWGATPRAPIGKTVWAEVAADSTNFPADQASSR
jgi:anti-sigma regulatory factor (Ser/Thr protein kinase)